MSTNFFALAFSRGGGLRIALGAKHGDAVSKAYSLHNK